MTYEDKYILFKLKKDTLRKLNLISNDNINITLEKLIEEAFKTYKIGRK